jgi:hypothetical protein
MDVNTLLCLDEKAREKPFFVLYFKFYIWVKLVIKLTEHQVLFQGRFTRGITDESPHWIIFRGQLMALRRCLRWICRRLGREERRIEQIITLHRLLDHSKAALRLSNNTSHFSNPQFAGSSSQILARTLLYCVCAWMAQSGQSPFSNFFQPLNKNPERGHW